MFPILRQHWTLWALWTLATSLALFANPWMPFSWAEFFACLGSLVLAIDARTRRETLLAIGLPTIALLCIVDGEGASVMRFVVDWSVFIGAVLFGARAVDDQRELESIAGHLVLGEDPDRARSDFRAAVAQEIARSRRHDRAFVVLSVAPVRRALLAATESESHVMKRLVEARWMLEIAYVLEEALHRYSSVLPTERRVLCVVPEVEESATEALVERLADIVEQQRGIEVEIGVARYPSDALAVEDLIDTADDHRPIPRLESVPQSGATPSFEAASVERS